jgi:hypothetical protein
MRRRQDEGAKGVAKARGREKAKRRSGAREGVYRNPKEAEV